MGQLTHKSTGWEGTATQAGTYIFSTKEKYMDQDIKFTVASAAPAFDGGGLSKGTASGGGLSGGGLTAGSGEVSVSNGTVTPSIGGTVTTATGYGVTTTKPSGTDGTNYLTLDPGASVTTNGTAKGRGSVSRAAVTRAAFSQPVTRAAVLYNGAATGYINKADNTQALAADSTGVTVSLGADSTTIGATSGTSNWSSSSSTNPTIAAGTNYYVPIIAPSKSGGTVSWGAGVVKSGSSTVSRGDLGITDKAAATYNTSTSDQTIASGNYLTGAQTIKAVTTQNIDAANIKMGVVVKVGDANSTGRIKNVTGTLDYTSTVTSVPTTKTTSVIYNSTDDSYYIWRD